MARSYAKALSVLLSAVLTFGTIPVPAYAQMAEEAMGTEPTHQEANAQQQESNMGEQPAGEQPVDVPPVEEQGDASEPSESSASDSEMGTSNIVGQAENALVEIAQGDNAPAETARATEDEEDFLPEGRRAGALPDPIVPSVHDANESTGLSTQSTLPSAYSSRDAGIITSVRDQGPFGICWAFATTACVEANTLKKNLLPDATAGSLDFSERHLAYFTSNTLPDPLGNFSNDHVRLAPDPDFDDEFDEEPTYFNTGGNAYTAGLTLSRWTGAASEATAPYADFQSTYERYKASGTLTFWDFLRDTNLSDDIARSDEVHLRDFRLINVSDTDKTKQAVMDNGAVYLRVKINSSYFSTHGSYRYLYVDDPQAKTSHAVTIVGWDDSISRTNFSGRYTSGPEHDGAWLCKNSYGTDNVGEGYIWVSYDDVAVAGGGTAATFSVEPSDQQDNQYLYDGGISTYTRSINSGGSIASVFEATANDAGEILDAVSVFIYDTNVDYSVQVYADPTDEADPTSGSALLASPITGKGDCVGLYKLELPQEVVLYPGERFAVVATLSHQDGSSVKYGLDRTQEDWFINDVQAEPGETFEKSSASSPWRDMASDIGNGDNANRSARVRAYTSNTDLSSRMTLDRATISPIPNQLHTGYELCPEPEVRLDGHLLRKDVDYILSYSDNIDLGSAYVHVTGIGGYGGSLDAGFQIVDTVIDPLVTSRDGVDWSAVYDPEYYAEENPDVEAWARRADGTIDGDKLLQHFVNNGAKEGRRSKDGFELASYYNANADLRRAFGTSDWSKFYRHYATNGYGENRACSGVGELRGAVVSRDGVDWSPAYDGNYYAAQNGDVARWATRTFSSGSVLDDAALLQHFVSNGAKEGRRSKDGFELASYYNANADLRRAFGTSDWSKYYRHYVTNGAKENRTCSGVGELRGAVVSRDGVDWSPAYDGNYYAAQNGDVANWARRSFNSGSVLDDAALLQHFVNNGSKEGRRSKDGFELASYYNANADLRRAFGTSDWSRYYRHYATNGARERRTCTGVDSLRGFATSLGGVDWAPVFDANEYAQRNADLARWATRSMGASGSVFDDAALLSHFVNNGQRERRQAKSTFNVTNYRNRYADLRSAFGDDWPRYYRHFATTGSRENRNGA